MKRLVLFIMVSVFCSYGTSFAQSDPNWEGEITTNLIWYNRFMAIEERADNASLGFTTFEKVSGGNFYQGMLVRELK